jgi:hypothetical protein
MASLNDPDVRIMFLIREQTNKGLFCDALIFTRSQYDAITNAERNSMVRGRVDAWRDSVKPISLTKAQKQAARAEMADQLARVDADIAATP